MNRPEPETRALDAFLARLHRRLGQHVLLHGVGTVAAAAGAWLAFAFLADYVLHVPLPIRIFHGIALVLVLGYFSWRDLLRPLSRLPDESQLAVLVERAHPELSELLISAVQLQGEREAARAVADPELVASVIRAAEARAATLDARGILDEERPRARFLIGASLALGLGALGAFNPGLSSIFFDRLVGGSRPWPQRTELVVEVHGAGAGSRLEESPELLHLLVARGTDVPVLVRAIGVVPDEITLHFEGSRDVVLNPIGPDLFRTLLRSLQEDTAFHVTGGDDEDGLPRVEITVLQPPDVESVAMAVEPPEYSGIAPAIAFQQDVEVLAGSRVRVHVLPHPRDAEGRVRILNEDAEIELQRLPFPPDPRSGDGPLEPDAMGMAFDFVATKSVGFRFELTDANGLTNPDPGLFRVRVLEDRAPDVAVVSPSRGDFEIVEGGAIPLRVRAQDDFGVVSMHLVVRTASMRQEPGRDVLDQELPWSEIDVGGDAADPDERLPHTVLGVRRLEVAALGSPESPLAVDQRFELVVTVRDNRTPDANEGRTMPIRARVVTPGELLRRMQDRLAQARLTAVQLGELQRERRQRVIDLLDALEGDGAHGVDALALSAALSGERRVQGDALALGRDLATVAEDILYSRLDEKAGGLLEFYDARTAGLADLRFHSEPMRALAAAQRENGLGQGGFAATLVGLVDLALEIGQDHAGRAIEALDEAEKAIEPTAVQDALLSAAAHEAAAQQRIEDLIDQLSEWDNFQNILALTRDILNRQKALRDRTQQFASEK